MRKYELAFIVDPDLDAEALASIEERVTGWISGAGGTILSAERGGRKRLAYPIRKKQEGYYFFLDVEMPPHGGADLERNLRLSEPVLRFLLTVRE